jgi:polyhydroxyalkanoate synthesis regulator phasin
MAKRSFVGLLAGLVLMTLAAQAAWASEVDILVKKLVEKGILTQDEAQQIVAETKEEVRKEAAQAKPEAVPKWVQNLKFNGDMRLRYQGEHRDIDKSGGGERLVRNRMRFRLRTGLDAKVLDRMNVAFGLASGSDADPRSTNQTFQDSFSKKPVWIDYAYAKWTPIDQMIISGGKIKNPFWTTSDNLWDGDINPEGGALQVSYKPTPDVNLFLNTAGFIVDELGVDVDDPWMVGIQPGFDWYFIPDKASVKVAFTYYELFNETGRIPDWSAGTNTLRTGGDGIRYNFRPMVIDGSVSFKEPFAGILYLGDHVHYIGIFANGVVNPPAEEKLGGLIGCEFGDQKISKLGQWKLSARYEYLARDAWPDWLPDSDTYYGGTNVKGPRARFELGLMDNVWFTATYLNTKYIIGPARPQNLWQCDINWRF